MSRSYRKPYSAVTGTPAMTKWKKMANRTVRNKPLSEEIPNGNKYKLYEDNWMSPRDGRQHYYPEDPKIRRK